ncbi:hypothetical protein BG015_007324 [Linnemannia schmuckeri]|uniref:Uncharacterized protein n=1 Tax=Linnemannia schmuckeri TaxID=64567 RepID=A0A9P5VBD8_9FUNG|nr:hypothetical protein BG015_007324 [Linnemannia schmuckeri]
MTRASTLRIAAALALIACGAQAAPIIQSDTFPISSIADANFRGDMGMSGMYGGIGGSISGGDPLSSYCDPSVDSSCYQNVHSGNVDIGSVVNAVPVTQVTPVTQYQPVVQALAPIVDSACDYDYDSCLFDGESGLFGDGSGVFGGGSGLYGGGSGLYGGSGLGDGLYGGSALSGGGEMYGSDDSVLRSNYGGLTYGQDSMMRRNDLEAARLEGFGDTYVGDATNPNVQEPAVPTGEVMSFGSGGGGIFGFNALPGPQDGPQSGPMDPQTFHSPQGGLQIGSLGGSQGLIQCAPNDIACQLSIPSQTVDMGSSTLINPSISVFPSTTYQPQVQSLDSDIFATPAQDNTLPQQSVDLSSNVFIQPTTSVNPETVYQPSISQFATDVQAVPQQDQSLPQSSVQLGSSVQIVPTVHVQPITTFQSTVKSLPVIIQAEPCNDVDYFGRTGGLYGSVYGSGIGSAYGSGIALGIQGSSSTYGGGLGSDS